MALLYLKAIITFTRGETISACRLITDLTFLQFIEKKAGCLTSAWYAPEHHMCKDDMCKDVWS